MGRVIIGIGLTLVSCCGRIGFRERPDDAADAGVSIDAGPPPVATSGSRLRVESWVADDGSKAFDAFYDTVLDTECEFGIASDGVLRCLPIGASVIIPLFIDAACTLPVARWEGCETPKYAESAVPGHAYAIGDEATTAYGGTQCAPVAVDGRLFGVGAEIAASAMVSATAMHASSGSRISAEQFVSEDGATITTGAAFDNLLGVECVPEQSTGQADVVCGPTMGLALAFADAAASIPIYGESATEIATGSLFRLARGGIGNTLSCGVPDYHVTGTSTMPTTFYFFDGPAETLSSGLWFAADDGVVPRSTFVSGSYSVPRAGRIGTRVWIADDGSSIQQPGIWDSALEVTCVVGNDDHGVQRCLPSNFAGGYNLAPNTTCSAPSLTFITCDGTPAQFAVATGSATCGRSNDGVYTGTLVSPSSTYDGSGVCVDAFAGAAPGAAWAPGTVETPPQTFTTLTTVIE